ncbi:MAG: class I SAM-dependent methyltransferase, partial [Spirochaetales bacterium]
MTFSEPVPSFPWTYDQLQRYAVLRLLVEELERPLRVLDVGGAAADRVGTGFWLPAAEILAGTGADITVADVSDCRLPGFIKASGTDLPFADASFDVVSAFDVLEHVPKAERPAFLAELGRIASRAVLVSCPTKSPGVERAEALLNAEILRQYGIEHGMLVEHRTFGLPIEEDVGAALEGAGLTAVSFG